MQHHILCGERWSTMNCVWTLVHLHYTSRTFQGNHSDECVDFSDLSGASVGQTTTQLGRFTLFGTTAAELHNSEDLLCGTTAAELHNSVDLLCGTTAAELNNPVPLMHAPGGCMQGVERFGRFNRHASIVDLQQTPEICTLSVTRHAENMNGRA